MGQHFAESFFIHQPDCRVGGTFFQLGELTSDLKWEGRLSSQKVPFFRKKWDSEASIQPLQIPRPCRGANQSMKSHRFIRVSTKTRCYSQSLSVELSNYVSRFCLSLLITIKTKREIFYQRSGGMTEFVQATKTSN